MCAEQFTARGQVQAAQLRAWVFGDGPTPRGNTLVRVEDTKGVYAPRLYSFDRSVGVFDAQIAALDAYYAANKHRAPTQTLFCRFRLTLTNAR